MDIAPLLTGSRWQLLEAMANRPLSPGELAEVTQTTTANVSAQLRLLEASGIVSKIRLGTAEPGKPRILYTLPANQAYIVSLAKNRVTKQVVRTSAFESLLIAILTSEVKSSTAVVQFLCTHMNEFLEKKYELAVETNSVTIVIEGKGRKIEHKQDEVTMIITFAQKLNYSHNIFEDENK